MPISALGSGSTTGSGALVAGTGTWPALPNAIPAEWVSPRAGWKPSPYRNSSSPVPIDREKENREGSDTKPSPRERADEGA